jgi:hypothetical protein
MNGMDVQEPRRRHWRPCPAAWRAVAVVLLAVAGLTAAPPASAQLGLGAGRSVGGGLGGGIGGTLGGLGDTDLGGLVHRGEGTLRRDLQDAARDTGATVQQLVHERQDTLDALLRREPQRLERLSDGTVVVRGELLLESPSPALLAAAQAAGFRVEHDEALGDLGLRLVVLHAPGGVDTAAALARLRSMGAPEAADVNPLYLPAGEAAAPSPPGARRASERPVPLEPHEQASLFAQAGPAPVPPHPLAPAASGLPASTTPRVGLVDGAPDLHHPALRALDAHAFSPVPGCVVGAHADAHGTAVASLLAGRDGRFRGAAPQAALYAADIYCGDAANGSADAVLRALAWLAGQQVPVINLSIVGPPNRLLERAVATLVQRGHLLVAAVGNDGPAAPPLYPAAYHGVVGVTGVTPQGRVLPEALQGPQVAFAAPGSAVAAAAAGGDGYRVVRGTSFAAPFVAGLLAQRLARPDAQAAAAAQAALAHEAVDLGVPGRDPVYGEGWVARALRVEPSAVGAGATD